MTQLIDMFAPTRQTLAGMGQAFAADRRRGLQDETHEMMMDRGLADLNLKDTQQQIANMSLEDLQKQRVKKQAFDDHMSKYDKKNGDHDRYQLEYLAKTDQEAAAKLDSEIVKKALNLSKLDPKSAIEMLNKKTGRNLEYVKEDGDLHIVKSKSTGVTVALNKETGVEVWRHEGTPEVKAKTKAETDANFEQKLAKEYAAMDPELTDVEAMVKAKETLEAIKLKGKEGSKKEGKNYLLKDNSIVTSFDGGRTFKGTDGEKETMPFGAVKISATITGKELNVIKAKEQAETETPIIGDKDIKEVQVGAELGTGPYSALMAAVDNMAGGVGIDKLFGQDGLFPETQKNRQLLRIIKQTGKAALLNSAKGAVWEQEKIDMLFPDPDKFFVNPRTEAKKFNILRQTMLEEKAFNNDAIKNAIGQKEIEQLRKSNRDIDKLLVMIGTGVKPGLSEEDKALINKYSTTE